MRTNPFTAMRVMQEYFRINKLQVFGAPIYVHWSVLASSAFILVAFWKDLIVLALALLCFFSIILIHEIGHAVIAHYLGYRVFEIRICLIHGVCEYSAPNYEWDEVKVSWGGVLAQMVVAIIVFTASSLGAKQFDYFAPVLLFLGYYSLLVIPFNLMPFSLNYSSGREKRRKKELKTE
jgi:hypothetical protein